MKPLRLSCFRIMTRQLAEACVRSTCSRLVLQKDNLWLRKLVKANCLELLHPAIEIEITATTRESVFHTRSRTDLVGSASIT